MRVIPKWADKIHDSEKNEQCIYDLCFNPDGTQLIVASGQRVLVYDATDGTLIQTLRGHRDTVYCVAYSRDSKKFASGSADKTVIIWSSKLEGILKYSHSDAVQCLAYNPLSNQLASCALSDFAFWSTEQKAVQKFKVNSRINACSWTNDGQYLALGLGNGTVSIRNKLGEEKVRIDRTNTAVNSTPPQIWALSWSSSKEEPSDILCVTDWNQSLTFYTLGGKLIGKERQLGFEALKLRYFAQGEYILICGTNKFCSIYTKEGIKLGTVGDVQSSWVWCCASHPNFNLVALGCQDGTLAYYQLAFNTVHALYKERYAFRENMTDVIIQHLLTEQKVRIKCRDLIKKIAIYKHRLAVQLPERIVIYELYSKDSNDMHYRVRDKITQKLECNLLVVCTKHLIICQERKLHCMTFTGTKEREWVLDSTIRYIKVIGGPTGKEGLILGLKNGQVWKIFLNNAFPVLLVTISAPIRCLDISSERKLIAVVDENGLCQVFEANTGEMLFQEHNVNSVAWNTNYENMLAFSGNNSLAIKVSDFPIHRQKLNGFVVGLIGSQVFCLNGAVMSTVDLPLSAPMYQYLDKKMFKEAYAVSCLGVTFGDWEELAFTALENLELDIGKQAFSRLQNYTYLELIRDLQDLQQKGDCSREVMIAHVLAYRGKFKEAARLYQKAGEEHRALTMYTDLRMFDLAHDYLGTGDHKVLIRHKAEWARNINEPKAAVDMYLSIGDVKTAIEIMGENGWTDQLIDLGRRLDKTDKDLLLAIATHLKQHQQTSAAAELYRRLDDTAAVIMLHVEAREWTQAFVYAEQQPQHRALVYIPYAHWLAENDKFVQAQKAFHKSGSPSEAFKVLKELTENAVNEYRFQDAGYYYWILSKQCLDIAREDPQREKDMLANYYSNERLASIYYAYHVIHRYLEEPFTTHMAEGLFSIARFLINEILDDKPREISLFAVLYALHKQARVLGANKLAKQLLDRIHTLKIPSTFVEQVEISTMAVRAKSFCDPEELLPMCYRCSTYNSFLSNNNTCNNCGQKFVFSYVTFEILPLVQFELEDGITDIEAVRLIESPSMNKTKSAKDDGFVEELADNYQTLQIGEEKEIVHDNFTERLLNFENGDGQYIPLMVNRSNLSSMDSSSVLICKWQAPLKYQYFRNLLPDVPIIMCNTCFKAFHVDDFELQILQKGYCPFCRTPAESYGYNDTTDDLVSIL